MYLFNHTVYSRNQFSPCSNGILSINDVSNNNISLRVANSKESLFKRQEFLKCFCTTKCKHNKCIYKKNTMICNYK